MSIWRDWRVQLAGRPPETRESAHRQSPTVKTSQAEHSMPPMAVQTNGQDDALWHVAGPCPLCAAHRNSRGPITVSTTVSLGPSGPIALVGSRSTR
jgi:hypothetical protein